MKRKTIQNDGHETALIPTVSERHRGKQVEQEADLPITDKDFYLTCQFRQSRLDLLQRFVCRMDVRVRLSSFYSLIHLNRKTQKIESRLGGIHDVGLALAKAETKTFQYMTHRLGSVGLLFQITGQFPAETSTPIPSSMAVKLIPSTPRLPRLARTSRQA